MNIRGVSALDNRFVDLSACAVRQGRRRDIHFRSRLVQLGSNPFDSWQRAANESDPKTF